MTDTENTNPQLPKHNPYRAFIIVLVAVLIVGGISYLPLEQITDGKMKNFNLLADIFDAPTDTVAAPAADATEGIDPELAEAMRQGEILPVQVEEEVDTTSAKVSAATVPSATANVQAAPVIDTIVMQTKPARVGSLVQIEDYTSSQGGLRRLRSAVNSGRLARIAVIGDSYIEGDIMTQDLRDQLQSAYGGSGVGYMNMFSEFPGFRRSVKQSGKGWTEFAASKKGGSEQYYGISEHYFKPSGTGSAEYKGTSSLQHTSRWDMSKFLFIAPQGGSIKAKIGEEWKSFDVEASPAVQCISIPGSTAQFAVETSSPIIALGVWLDANKGVSVDCMSSRGYSGITLTKVSPALTRQMSKYVDYDLIILEFGINAMSAGQKDYKVYANRMVGVVNHVRNCYPNADILIMGVGDRGEKSGGTVKSMAAGNYMISAQRDVARRTHTLFWDTKEAMGGENAIVEWSKNGMANKDYIHLTHKGGKQLATELTNAIKNNINR